MVNFFVFRGDVYLNRFRKIRHSAKYYLFPMCCSLSDLDISFRSYLTISKLFQSNRLLKFRSD